VLAPVPVPPGYPGFPDRDTDSNAPPSPSCPEEVAVAIAMHGSEDQVKDASSAGARERAFPQFSCPVHALRRVHADVVPFLGALWTSVVAGACAERGGDPFSTPDRTKTHVPTLTREGQRHPVDRDAFHRGEAR